MRCCARTGRRMSQGSRRSALVVLAVSVGLVSGFAVAIAPLAIALPVWSVVPSPNPVGAHSVALSAVSCSNTNSCFAVGEYAVSSSATRALVESWDGIRWSMMAIPDPAGSTATVLSGVSCSYTTSCFAVGYSSSGSHHQTLVARWDGSAWSILPSPNPTGARSAVLRGVSCSNTISCYAVGDYTLTSPATKPLVESWDGTSWSIVASPNPPGARSTVLSAVSCSDTTSCFAVGYYSSGSHHKALVERWNGADWSIMASPNPTGSTGTVLSGVSCSNTFSCAAVGDYALTSPVTKPLVERWNGGDWSIVASPNPTGSTGTVLSGVSCSTTINCFAVGYYSSGSHHQTLVESWGSSGWSIMATPSHTGAHSSALSAVSYPAPTNGYAVGTASNTLVEQYAQ